MDVIAGKGTKSDCYFEPC